jgi:hypothetical protein
MATPAAEQSMLSTPVLAERLCVSADTVLRIMRSTPGVLHLGTGARTLYRMQASLRSLLLAEVGQKVWQEMTENHEP